MTTMTEKKKLPATKKAAIRKEMRPIIEKLATAFIRKGMGEIDIDGALNGVVDWFDKNQRPITKTIFYRIIKKNTTEV